MDDYLLNSLAARLGSESLGLVSAYLFGSHAEGRSHRESDIDIGILLDRKTYPTEAARLDVRIRLAATLQPALNAVADIVILNDAPPGLAARIVTTGQRLVCRDSVLDHAFRRDAQLKAADLAPFLLRTRRIKLQAIVR